MKRLITACVSGVLLLGGSVLLVRAQEKKEDTAVTGGIWTGVTAIKPLPKPREKREYTVKQTFKRNVGGRSVTIQEVEQPPEVTKPTPIVLPFPLVGSSPHISNEKILSTEFIVVSSTVYGKGDDRLTKLTVWNRNKQVTCWSNINGYHLTNFDQFKANGQPYWMISTAGDAANPDHAKEDGCPVHRFRRGGKTPRFVIVEGQQADPELRKIVEDLHKLYRVEKNRLAAAHTARTRNAQLQAGIPKPPPEPPKPVTIRFWKRDLTKGNQERGTR